MISYKLLGTREWFVIHHTDCGMEFFTNEVMRSLLRNSLETAELTPQGFKDVGTGPGSVVGDYIEWHTIADQQGAVVDDVTRIRHHPLVPKTIPVYADAEAFGTVDRSGGGHARRCGPNTSECKTFAATIDGRIIADQSRAQATC